MRFWNAILGPAPDTQLWHTADRSNSVTDEGENTMDLDTNITLYIAGGLLFLIGVILRRWASRHDLQGALTDSAWQVVRGKRRDGQTTEIEERFSEITSAPTTAGKVRRATGSIIGHFLSATAGLVGLILILAGLATAAVGYFVYS